MPIALNNILFLITNLKVTWSNCTDYDDVQLVDGYSLNEQRLLICINGVWGTPCNNGNDYNDAGVICFQLGYRRGLCVYWLFVM